MLSCTTMIESEIRTRLRNEFGITLPRFDLMAQLQRHPDGLRMGELSKRMMVTGGNITGITDQLEHEKLVLRVPDPKDRRAYSVKLTAAGRRSFERMAQVHEGWIAELLDGLSVKEKNDMIALLSRMKGAPHQLPGNSQALADYQAAHFKFEVSAGVATVTLNRPERKNPLTFDSYAELRDLFRALAYAGDVKAVVITGAGENFCSGGDVHDIIGPLTKLDMPGLLAFTRMTGDLVKAVRACPQPVIAAIDGICAGAGANAVDGGDHRLRTGAHGFHQVAGHAGEGQQAGHVQFGERADDVVHVAAGAEVLAGAGDDDRLHITGVRQRAEQVAQLGVGVEGEGVLAFRAVQRDGGDAGAHFELEVRGLIVGQRLAVAGQ
eukprot:gene31080-38410_t